MPEAIKEVQDTLPIEKKEVQDQKPTEGCSGTLPVDDKTDNPTDGTKPEEGLEADQPPLSAEQPATEEKPSGSVALPEMNGKEKDPLEAGDAPVVNGADVLPEGALQNGSECPSEPAKPEEGNKGEGSTEGGSSQSSRSPAAPSGTSQEPRPSSSEFVWNREAEEAIQTYVVKGKMKFTLGDYDAASELLGKACEVAVAAYGDLSERCGDLYFDYGCALLECGKMENTLLGEGVKEEVKEEEEEEEEILPQVIDKTKDPEPIEEKKEKEEMEVESGDKEKEEPETEISGSEKEKGEEPEEKTGKDEESGEKEEGSVEEETTEDKDDKGGSDEESTEQNEEEDESSLKVAWEMFELAKLVYIRFSHKERLIETYIKLGEVNFESGNFSAIEDMVRALKLQKEVYPDDLRRISHSHFQIGLTLATFEKFEEAGVQFKLAKELLITKMNHLECLNSKDAVEEQKEISELLPEIDEKINDMEDSKKEKLKELSKDEAEKEAKVDENKPTTNISHLVKRKRKIDEVASDIQAPSPKQPAVDESS